MHQVAEKVALALLGGFIAASGGIAVALWSDRLVRERERKEGIADRKRDFLAFMESWQHEIGRLFMADGGAGFEHREGSFSNVVSDFKYRAGLIKRDFTGDKRQQFETLCAAVVGWQHQSIYGKENNEKVKKAMNDLIIFVENSNT